MRVLRCSVGARASSDRLRACRRSAPRTAPRARSRAGSGVLGARAPGRPRAAGPRAGVSLGCRPPCPGGLRQEWPGAPDLGPETAILAHGPVSPLATCAACAHRQPHWQLAPLARAGSPPWQSGCFRARFSLEIERSARLRNAAVHPQHFVPHASCRHNGRVFSTSGKHPDPVGTLGRYLTANTKRQADVTQEKAVALLRPAAGKTQARHGPVVGERGHRRAGNRRA